MTKQKIIAAITRLAHDATIAPAERQKHLDIRELGQYLDKHPALGLPYSGKPHTGRGKCGPVAIWNLPKRS